MGILDKARKVLGISSVRVGALNEAAMTRPRSPTKSTSSDLSLASIMIPPAYEQAQALIEAECPLIFVSGNAGTGKTTLIRHLLRKLNCRSVVLAPTGVAALNAGGSTVHSFFRFPPKIQDAADIQPPTDRALYQKLQLLILDEVSMLRCDLMDAIDVFLRKARRNQAPFGGVQLLLVGDLFQLPPVVPLAEREVLEARGYASPYFFSANSLQDMALCHVELDQVHRQTDANFVSLLNRLRVAEDTEEVVTEINRHCYGMAVSEHQIILTATNKVADHINELALVHLSSPEHLFTGTVEGTFRIGRDRLPSPADLRLKVGSQVMFTKNDDQQRWVNGSLGVVRGFSEGAVQVQMTGGSTDAVCDVVPASWETYEYRFDSAEKRIISQKIGEYRQYPLMLAWAVTIHKSQGKTLDRILVDLGSGAFATGQAYVALSRVRSLDSVRLARPLRVTDVRCDPAIIRFYQGLRETKL